MIRSKYCNAIIAVVTGLAVIAVALMGYLRCPSRRRPTAA